MICVAIANQKGGVGKTTTAINVATAFAAAGWRTLLIDLDPQGNASTGVGVHAPDRLSTSWDVIVDGLSIAECTQPTTVPGLDLIPATVDLSGAEVELVGAANRVQRLRDALARERDYDIAFIDCPPSLGLLTLNALTAADTLLVPLQCEFFALEGLSQLLHTVDEVQKRFNPDLGILGIVLTMADRRNRLSDLVAEDVRASLGKLVFEVPIPRNVRLSEAPSHGLPALVYDQSCAGSRAYVALVREMIARLPKRKIGRVSEDSIVRISVPSAKRKAPALGRGLGALLGDTRREESVAVGEAEVPRGGGLALLSIATIEPHPDQPRRHFDEAALDELAASISQRGVIQPVIVRPLPAGRYQLVAGERRWRAAQKAQLHEIPALIRDLSERDVKALALIENLQREDLNPIEEARAYQRLAEEESLTQAEIAKMVDKSRSHVANLQRLLALPESVIALVESGKLSMGHARALIGAENAEAIAENAVVKGWSVREVEALVRKATRGDAPAPRRARPGRTSEDDADIAAVQGNLEELLGLPVKILSDADPASGAVTIRYRTLDQLDLICQRLSGGSI